MTKNSIRKNVLSHRDGVSVEAKKQKDANIRDRLINLHEFAEAYKILLYASFRSEVDTFDLIKYCIANGKIVALPKVNKERGELRLYEIKDMGELTPGYFGILEPSVSEDRAMSIDDMDMAIIPGAAFDEHCSRLGYGKGFYDKLLSETRSKIIGLAYEEQIVESVPSELHDIKMDKIITDKRIITYHG
ncbi:MAG: 5-formyltetrahydrofolate cyclo-ligase [Thermodesulfovibrionales bacterium]|nr:5-formyltetrahydrofolate cyclo-ligase [Thermodesulfovibrionales bacterium]